MQTPLLSPPTIGKGIEAQPTANSIGAFDRAVKWTPLLAASELSRWRSLLSLGSPLRCAPRTTLFAQGDKPNDIFLLASGVAKLVLLQPSGNELVVALRYPGQFVNYFSAGVGAPSSISGITIVASDVYRINVPRVRAVQQGNPGLSIQPADLLWADLCSLAAKYVQLKSSRPICRLAQLLWELAAILGKKDSPTRIRLVLPLNNFEMASLCGISESHYKAVRHELEATGHVSHEARHVWILTKAKPLLAPVEASGSHARS